jgi:hypothetical protein
MSVTSDRRLSRIRSNHLVSTEDILDRLFKARWKLNHRRGLMLCGGCYDHGKIIARECDSANQSGKHIVWIVITSM